MQIIISLIIWAFGVCLSFLPLLFVALLVIQPNSGPTLLEALSNEELLAVAFTLGGVAAVDVIARAGWRVRGDAARLFAFRLGIGALTLLLTFVCVGIYVLLKSHATHWAPEATVLTVQFLYGGTVALSFLCEWRS